MPMTIAELDEKIQEIDRQIAYFCPPDYEMLYEAPFNKSVADKLRAVRDELKKLRDSTVCATSGKIRTDTDEYFSDDCLYSRSEIAGLKEYHVDDIIVGDRFYIPLPWYLGDDMNEQKFLRCIAKKDIPRYGSARMSSATSARNPDWMYANGTTSRRTCQTRPRTKWSHG